MKKFTSYGSTGPGCDARQLKYWVNKFEIIHDLRNDHVFVLSGKTQ